VGVDVGMKVGVGVGANVWMWLEERPPSFPPVTLIHSQKGTPSRTEALKRAHQLLMQVQCVVYMHPSLHSCAPAFR